MPVRNMHQHTANIVLFNSFLCACVPRLAVSTTLRNGSDLHYNISMMLCWELQLVAAPFRSNNNRQNVAARDSR